MEEEREKTLNHKIHAIMARSYSMHFVLLLLGIALDLLIPLRIFKNSAVIAIGLFFLVLASVLIFWAQRTTRNLHKHESLRKEDFEHGPYRFTRTPTHLGLLILTLGFGIVLNAFFVVVTAVLAAIIGKLVYLRKYEDVLVDKYGDSYLLYKKEVKL